MAEANLAERIEKRIDKDVTGSLTIVGTGGAVSIVPHNFNELLELSKAMSTAGVAIRPQFRGNPGACLAITMQALKWGIDPFSVANKAYVTKSKSGDEQLAYEAQLIDAVINLRAPLTKKKRVEYSGEGPTRKCKVRGYILGEDEPFEYESPEISKIGVKNSPLWTADPDQQLYYYSTRAWARRHFPEIIMGAYTPDEIEAQERQYDPARLIDATPRPTRNDPPRETQSGQVAPEPFEILTGDGEIQKIADATEAAEAFIALLNDAAKAVRDAVDVIWNDNTLPAQLRERAHVDLAERCHKAYGEALAAARKPPQDEGIVGEGDASGILEERG